MSTSTYSRGLTEHILPYAGITIMRDSSNTGISQHRNIVSGHLRFQKQFFARDNFASKISPDHKQATSVVN